MDNMYTFHGILIHRKGQYVHISWYFIHINGLYVNVENLSLFAISSECVFVAGSSDFHFILEIRMPLDDQYGLFFLNILKDWQSEMTSSHTLFTRNVQT